MQASYELEIQSALNQGGEQDHPTLNPSVARCCEAYNARFRAVLAIREHACTARHEARLAYRMAMPPLSSPRNIGDFVACVAHATLIEAIEGSDAARLLYAAQVAHRVLRSPSSPEKVAS
ncbi:MAG: hypothetical protein ABR923_19000 [Terracidiphilus sp.]|jgi:hypothetical protein